MTNKLKKIYDEMTKAGHNKQWAAYNKAFEELGKEINKVDRRERFIKSVTEGSCDYLISDISETGVDEE